MSCFQIGYQWLYVQPVPGLPAETAKNVSDGAKSNYWVLVCRCWKLVSILTFRKGVIIHREQRILKIALACPCEAGTFVVILLDCLTEGSGELSSLSGSKACLTGRVMQSSQECLGPLGISLFRCMLKRPDLYWEIALRLMKIWALTVPTLGTQKLWLSGLEVPFKCFQQKSLRLRQVQTPKL